MRWFVSWAAWQPFLKVYGEADSTISLLLSFNKIGFKEVPPFKQQIPPTILWVHFLSTLVEKRIAEMHTHNMTLCALKSSLPLFPACCPPSFIHAFNLIIAATIHWHQFCARHHTHILAPSSIISRIPIFNLPFNEDPFCPQWGSKGSEISDK